MTKSPKQQLREKMDKIIDDAYKLGKTDATLEVNDAEALLPKMKAKAKNLIDEYALSERIDELSNIQLEHGNYLTQTFVNGRAITIEERINELKSQ